MTESVIITGSDLAVEHKPAAGQSRRQRPELLPIPDGPTRGMTPQQAMSANPFWSVEANEAAESNPDRLRPKDLAKIWRKHRIEKP